MKIRLSSLQDLKEFAKKVLKDNPPQESGARVLALSGNLGAGKTAFSKMIGEELGVVGEITSPTFVIMKRYEISKGGFKTLIHIDAYRLESGKELTNLGFEKILEDKETLVIVEWPERVPFVVPDSATKLTFHVVNETVREVEY